MFRRRGQSTLEYVIVITAVIGVIIWAAGTVVRRGVNKSNQDVKQSIEKSAEKLQNMIQ